MEYPDNLKSILDLWSQRLIFPRLDTLIHARACMCEAVCRALDCRLGFGDRAYIYVAIGRLSFGDRAYIYVAIGRLSFGDRAYIYVAIGRLSFGDRAYICGDLSFRFWRSRLYKGLGA